MGSFAITIELECEKGKDALSKLAGRDATCAELAKALRETEGRVRIVARRRAKAASSSKDVEPPQTDIAEWTTKEVHWKAEIERVLCDRFALQTFRPNQRAVINAVMSGADVFALLPTGYGKSLCYQLPALCKTGLTIVISPLIALIHDQLHHLHALGIPAMGFFSDAPTTMAPLADPALRLVYTTPERAVGRLLDRIAATGRGFALFVVDEAHCVSRWGRDFRESYSALSVLRTRFPNVPLLCLSATAGPVVVCDTCAILGLNRPLFFKASFARSNLFLEVRRKDALQASKQRRANRGEYSVALSDLLAELRGRFAGHAGIVYCTSIAMCEEIGLALREELGAHRCAYYHSRISERDKAALIARFLSQRGQVVVATVAFGMGINKPDIRFVVHFNLPQSLEQYYQEVGRAGRDGLPAVCLLYYAYGDRTAIDSLRKEGKSGGRQESRRRELYPMLTMCEVAGCRTQAVLRGLGEDSAPCLTRCDGCRATPGPIPSAALISMIVEQVEANPGCFSVVQLVKALRARAKDSGELSLQSITERTVSCVVVQLLSIGVFGEKTKKFKQFRFCKLIRTGKTIPKSVFPCSGSAPPFNLTELLTKAVKDSRRARAFRELFQGEHANAISSSTVELIAENQPKSEAALAALLPPTELSLVPRLMAAIQDSERPPSFVDVVREVCEFKALPTSDLSTRANTSDGEC